MASRFFLAALRTWGCQRRASHGSRLWRSPKCATRQLHSTSCSGSRQTRSVLAARPRGVVAELRRAAPPPYKVKWGRCHGAPSFAPQQTAPFLPSRVCSPCTPSDIRCEPSLTADRCAACPELAGRLQRYATPEGRCKEGQAVTAQASARKGRGTLTTGQRRHRHPQAAAVTRSNRHFSC